MIAAGVLFPAAIVLGIVLSSALAFGIITGVGVAALGTGIGLFVSGRTRRSLELVDGP